VQRFSRNSLVGGQVGGLDERHLEWRRGHGSNTLRPGPPIFPLDSGAFRGHISAVSTPYPQLPRARAGLGVIRPNFAPLPIELDQTARRPSHSGRSPAAAARSSEKKASAWVWSS
jgi:hypothetical protein